MVYYEPIPASDGTSLTAPSNAEFRVFEVDDVARATPVELRTVAGTNAAPLVTTAQGVLPGVEVVSPNFSHIFKSGEWEWRRDSVEGIRAAAEAAQRSSTAAASEAQGAKVSAEAAASVAGEAAISIVKQKLDAGEFKGAPGQQGLPGLNAVPADAAVAAYIGSADSATHRAAASFFVGKGELVINARDYGAKGNGVADDTVPLNRAAADALTRGANARLYIPMGNYRITGTVTISCELDATQATLNYYGTGTALVLGVDESGVSTIRQKFAAPRVLNKSRTTGWDGTSIGIKAVNLNACDLYVPFVQDFEKGLVLFGKGAGITYTTVTIGALWDNHKNLVLDSDAAGYSNQMLFLGGRINQTLTKGATLDDVNANQISMIGASGGPAAGNNLFLNTSIETNGVAYHLVDVNGRYNQFINCRWEVPKNVAGRIRYGAGAQFNKIIGGYDAEKLIEAFTFPGLGGGTIEDGLGAYVAATSSTGQSIPHNMWNPVTGWGSPAMRRVTYDAASGNFTPRPGRWRITATVALTPGQATKFQGRIIANGAAADMDDKPASSTVRSVLKLNAVRSFDGTGVFRIEVLQVQGVGTAEQKLETVPAFVNVSAEYLGA